MSPAIGSPPSPPPAGGPDLGDSGNGGKEQDEQENWDFIASQAEPPRGDELRAEGFATEGWSAPAIDSGDEAQNPTAMLVARLWAEREHGGIIELHLAGGSVILPEWYDANWSRGTHGLFASPAADGSVTLTAVAWETVQKVVVRQLGEVPDDMFT